MKTCPYCAEEIQDQAIVCRHCGRDLVSKKTRHVGRWLGLLVVAVAIVIGLAVAFSDPIDATPENVAVANRLLAQGAREGWLLRIDEAHAAIVITRAAWAPLTERQRRGLCIMAARHFRGDGDGGPIAVVDQAGSTLGLVDRNNRITVTP